MSESDTIQKVDTPASRGSLAQDLRRVGLEAGRIVLVHSSLSRLGWVCGGATAVIQALQDALTPEGTLVMPAHSGDLSDPALWSNPPVPQSWWATIRETMPAYKPEITATRGMGAIAEAFRTWPGVQRSAHPALSFTAWGKNAGQVVANHTLEYSLGEGSPLARLYDLDAWVLLLGVGFANNTSFHLAEYRVPGAKIVQEGAPILVEGKRAWKTYRDVQVDDDPFAEIGADFEKTGEVKVGKVAAAETRFFRQRPAVDFAVGWLAARRQSSGAAA